MWPTRAAERLRIINELNAANTRLNLNGLPNAPTVEALAMQFIASLRREAYYGIVQSKPISAHRADPNHSSFDAERAVAFHMQQGNLDEAGWLIFLMTHFARHPHTGWLRLKDVYGQLGSGIWDWPTVTANPTAFYQWLTGNWQNIRGAFGNHRKYESLRPAANRSLQRVIADYLNLVGSCPNTWCSFLGPPLFSASV